MQLLRFFKISANAQVLEQTTPLASVLERASKLDENTLKEQTAPLATVFGGCTLSVPPGSVI